ncbi:MAG TPA: carboxypeptidase-like regulatory domain-containing protein, partial [Dysgonamonadaceae bacterium]|nr:carboxypeptidase-like regulatory domain-containing protein [Dysgonamonadaceae bacterium]
MNKNNSSGNLLIKKVPINHFLLIMRTTIFLLFTCVFCSMAELSYTQNARVTINKRNATIKEILNEIEKQTDYLFIYNDEIKANERVSVKAKQEAVSSVLNSMLKDKDMKYSMEGNHIILSTNKNESSENQIEANTQQQQKKRISGTVLDENGQPIIGANIIEAGTTNGTVTDIDGKFTLDVSDNATIRISYIGYLSQEISTAGKITFSIVLEEDTKTLEEVVVTALGVKREEKSLGYAVQNVSGSSLQTVKGVDMTASLTGKVAGLTIKNSTEFNARAGIEMRGETPLLVINGVPYGNMSLRDIPADEIENITTLKGATAAALYGSRGSAGAIMITTKRGKEKGLSIEFNSNTMFRAGWVAIPKAQTSYGHGLNGKIADDYVWGPKLDIGNTALQWNPVTKQE